MKKYLLFLVLSVALLPTSVWGQANLSQIDSLIKRMLPEASEVGISVYDLTAKKSLYTYRDTKLSRPASTMKLLTAITALSRPDADNPFRTEVWHDGVIEHDTLQGNLYVVGGFDPEFDSLMMDSLIEEVITFPFSVINGQVYGDVSMKDSLYWGHGWAWDDTPEAYQPYMSPLMFCKGAVEVTVVPGSLQGDTASVSCKPVSSYYTLTNRTKTRTPSAGKYLLSRDVAGLSMSAIMFFGAGAYMGIYKKNILEFCSRFRYTAAIATLLFLCCATMCNGRELHVYIVRMYVLFGIVTAFNLMDWLINRETWKKLFCNLSATVFFIYAAHEIYIINWTKGFFSRTSLAGSGGGLLLSYMLIPFITLGICLGLYYILNKMAPKALALLVGGRVKSQITESGR